MPRFAKYEENDEPIAGYRLVDFLGAGQFGEVWKAVDTESGIFVAIKLIDLSHSTSALKELKALNLVRNLRHPNLIPIFTARLKDKNGKEHPLHKADEVRQKGQLRELVIAMGLGDRSLSARLKQLNPDGTDPADFRGVPHEELLSYMEGAAKGIDYLNKADHNIGDGDGSIIHCDIKPDNMMVVAGEVQIADCGVAVIITPDARQTKAAGSPAYSAPELTGNKPVPGTDQYALAISYYELRTGRLPFDESMGQLSIMLAHAEGRLDFSSPVLSEYEASVLKWATAVQPKARYASCVDMVKQLTRSHMELPPMSPEQIGVKSGVVAVPLHRKPAKPLPQPSPAAKTQTFPPPEPVPAPTEELRGTVIPDSDRMIPPSQAGFTLPAARTPSDKRSSQTRTGPAAPPDTAAKFQPSQSEIVLPLDDRRPGDQPAANPGVTTPDISGTAVSRPQLATNPDDPLGRVHGMVELDAEIQAIIRQSGPLPPPARTVPEPAGIRGTLVPSAEQPAASPVVIPPVPAGKRSTQYPRETPSAAEIEADAEPQSLPTWAKEAAREEQRATATAPAALTTNWKAAPPPAKAGGLPAKLIVAGVLAGGLAAGGFFLLKPGKDDTPVAKRDDDGPPPPPPVDPNQKPPLREYLRPLDALITKATEATIGDAETAVRDKLAKAKADGYPPADVTAEELRLNRDLEDARKLLNDKGAAAVIEQIRGILADKNKTEDSLREAEKKVASLGRRVPDARIQDFTKQIKDARDGLALTAVDADLQKLLKGPPGRYGKGVQDLLDRFPDAAQKQEVAKKLIDADAGPNADQYRRAVVPAVAPDADRFPQIVPNDGYRSKVVGWHRERLPFLHETARAAVEKLSRAVDVGRDDVTSAQKAVAALRTEADALGRPFGKQWDLKAIAPEVEAFLAAAETWSKARDGKAVDAKALADLVQPDRADALSAPAAAFVMEHMRLAAAGPPLPVAALRGLRDAAAAHKWAGVSPDEAKRIDALFQNALAVQVRHDLSAKEPKWDDIRKYVGPDPANGWAALNDAEGDSVAKKAVAADVLAKVRKGEEFAAVDDPTAAHRKAFATYLRGIAGRDAKDAPAAEALAGLYQPTPEQAVPVLRQPFRLKAAADVLALNAIPTPPTAVDLTALLDARPYAARPHAKALDWLQLAVRLADRPGGTVPAEWLMHLALIAYDADKTPVAQAAVTGVKVDDRKLPPAGVPLALAFNARVGKDATLQDQTRLQAFAAAARLAFRALPAAFDPALTTTGVEDKEPDFFRAIGGKLLSAGVVHDKLADTRPPDDTKLSLLVSRQRAAVPPTGRADYVKWVKQTAADLDDLIPKLDRNNHPDLADALGYRAMLSVFRLSVGDLPATADAGRDADREQLWKLLHADARQALGLDPNNRQAHQAFATAVACEFGNYFPAPERYRWSPAQYATKKDLVRQAAASFDKACAALDTRKYTTFWFTRAKFLHAAANGFATAGQLPGEPDPTAEVRAFLEAAATAIQVSDDQRAAKDAKDKDGQPDYYARRYAEPLLRGLILEDLARLGRVDPARNAAAAVAAMTFDPDKCVEKPGQKLNYFEGLVDTARCAIRAVRLGDLDKSRLAAARDALDKLAAEKNATDPNIKAAQRDGRFWRGVLHRAEGDFAAADEAFEKFVADGKWGTPDAAQLAAAYAHRGENALDSLEAGRPITDAAKVADGSAKDLRAGLRDAGKDVTASFAFVPDYLAGRTAVAQKNPAGAKASLANALAAIQSAAADKALRVDDGFAVRCLAVGAVQGVPGCAGLLDRYHRQFPWALTAADRDAFKSVLPAP